MQYIILFIRFGCQTTKLGWIVLCIRTVTLINDYLLRLTIAQLCYYRSCRQCINHRNLFTNQCIYECRFTCRKFPHNHNQYRGFSMFDKYIQLLSYIWKQFCFLYFFFGFFYTTNDFFYRHIQV